jgi:hypothetical protein
VQWLDGSGFADLLRSTSLYRELDRDVREPLLDAVAERIRTRMGDRAARRYLSVLRVGRRADQGAGPVGAACRAARVPGRSRTDEVSAPFPSVCVRSTHGRLARCGN